MPAPCSGMGMDEIYPKLKACDGLIIASPVYFQSVSAQVKQFMDRTEGLLRYGTSQYQYGLQNKVGGGLVVGGNRNAGEELTMLELQAFFQVHDMIVVAPAASRAPAAIMAEPAPPIRKRETCAMRFLQMSWE